MKISHPSICLLAAAIVLGLSCAPAVAFESGSTGANGAFNPTVNTQVPLPANGVLNYTTLNIPAGVTVTFAKNTTNTPVVILVGGDAVIAGAISVNGTAGAATGAAGNGNIGDDGTPGQGGPGGFGGGQGGRVDSIAANRVSQGGTGPGGAGPSRFLNSSPCGGSGGSFGTIGDHGGSHHSFCLDPGATTRGLVYGVQNLQPLTGGSGGGGGAGGTTLRGAGGGGGAGGLLIAASGTLTMSGFLHANGGAGGAIGGAGVGGSGGSGSGGGIRLVATTLAGNGAISAQGGAPVASGIEQGGYGGVGRIRLEAENFTRIATSTPAHTFGPPGPVFVAGMPTLRIASVGGTAAPAEPTGNADITLPEGTTNPVAVDVATSGVPVGNTVTIVVTPAYGPTTSHVSNALSGTPQNATANASVTLPSGPSTLMATVSYSVPAAVAKQSPYRELSGEEDLIERVALEARPDGSMRRVGTTRTGREIDLSNVVAFGE